MSTDQTFTDRVAALFKSMPGQWIDARVIAQVGGFAAWRTRISECRQRGMPDIRNRQRVEDTPIGSYKVTEYCYFPEPQPRALDEAEDQPLPWEAA
jgi:hypothetical protein